MLFWTNKAEGTVLSFDVTMKKTNFVNMTILSTNPSRIQIKLVFVC